MNKKFFVTLLTTALFLISALSLPCIGLRCSFDDFEEIPLSLAGLHAAKHCSSVTVTITNKETASSKELPPDRHHLPLRSGGKRSKRRHGFRIAMNWDTLPTNLFNKEM